MVLTMRIICLVGKINMPLPTSKEGHECGVIQWLSLEENNSGGSYVSWKADKIDGLIIYVKTPKDILSYLNLCVK